MWGQIPQVVRDTRDEPEEAKAEDEDETNEVEILTENPKTTGLSA